MENEPKKQYTIKGEVVGTYESKDIDIDISLSDEELDRIKALIKARPECDDLREIVEDEFPEVYEQINDTLIPAAYKYYQQEYIDYAMGDDDNPGEIELTGEEYSCPIPEEWLPS